MSLEADIIEALAKVGARIAGSYARGEEHEGSDFDFYVTPGKWDAFKALAPPGWESCIVGHIGWHEAGVPIEASYHFRPTPRAQRKEERLLFGRTWKTR